MGGKKLLSIRFKKALSENPTEKIKEKIVKKINFEVEIFLFHAYINF